jgi:hypothetical protein
MDRCSGLCRCSSPSRIARPVGGHLGGAALIRHLLVRISQVDPAEKEGFDSIEPVDVV